MNGVNADGVLNLSFSTGQGCRLGFLGTLHMDVFRQRLEDEYDAMVIITAPTVPYKRESRPYLRKLVRTSSASRSHLS